MKKTIIRKNSYLRKVLFMKKISVVSLLVVLALPAMAKEEKVAQTAANVMTTSAAMSQPVIKTSNPKTKFPRGLQFGIGVSPTSGLNGFIGYNNKNFDSFWAKRFGVRFDFASYSPIKNRLNTKINDAIGAEGIKIEDNLSIEQVILNAKHYGALVDFYPFGNTWFLGGWRLSGGYMMGKLDLDGKIHGKNIGSGIEFELNGVSYVYTGSEMHGTAMGDWKYKGPYAGTGFDLGIFRGFKLFMDMGVVFTNKPAQLDLDIPLTDLTVGGQSVAENPTLVSAFNDAKAAELRKAQDELDKYPYYPLVKIGFMYRF